MKNKPDPWIISTLIGLLIIVISLTTALLTANDIVKMILLIVCWISIIITPLLSFVL